ncbi:Putative NAD(P)H-dependent FMN-containing oxidoreductase ywqN [Porphyromonas cangingivalis]|nr:Putative NAD(P)H-dependent FMN-containing oxidoreductase ywqN [Porphyromonas cangingivalis]
MWFVSLFHSSFSYVELTFFNTRIVTEIEIVVVTLDIHSSIKINTTQTMNVLLINGSARAKGNTFTALSVVAEILQSEGIDTHIMQIGTKPIQGCTGCGRCKTIGRCVFEDDLYNEASERMLSADALIVGSPTYFAGPNGSLTALLSRLLYSNRDAVSYKPAAAVVVARRGGATTTFDSLNRFFMACNMPIVSSQYWNIIHGETPGEVLQDAEGLQTLRVLGRNMSWLLKGIKEADRPLPEAEPKERTNFVR